MKSLVPFVFLVALAVLPAGCHSEETPATSLSAQTPQQTADANAGASASAITGAGTVLQLAIPVEISANGVRVLGEGQVIRAPRPEPGSGPQLTVTLQGAVSDGKFQRRYELPDPRLSEAEGRGQTVLPAARTFVYVDLSEPVSSIDVRPMLEAPSGLMKNMAFIGSANSTIDVSKVAARACSGTYASTALCAQLRPPSTPSR